MHLRLPTPKFPIIKTYSNQVRGNGVQTNMVRSVYSRYFKPDFKLEKYSTSDNQWLELEKIFYKIGDQNR